MKIKTFFNTILFLIMLAAAGIVFYLGWEQLNINENSYGIVYTKTSGWSDRLLTKEGFSWNIEKVIPTNYTLHQFKILKNNLNMDHKNYYPSGELYATFSNIPKDSFLYSYNLNFNLKFDKNFLVNFVNNGYFNQESYEEWISSKEVAVQKTLKEYLNNKINSGETFNLKGDALNYIKGQYPYFFIDELIINLNPGDRTLYTSARSRYLSYLEEQEIAEGKYLAKKLEQESNHKAKLELLKAYGEVFTQYPIMIEYIKADTGMELDRARLKDFISIQNQN